MHDAPLSLLQAAVLALVQGLTEFLPVSSSAHLILVPWALGWPDQGLTFDVVVHLGTLTAVCLYFRSDLAAILRGWLGSLPGGSGDDPQAARLGWFVVGATVPAVLAGLAFGGLIETIARDPRVIAATTIGFGLVLWAADRMGTHRRETGSLSWRDALLVGVSQALALVPGVSRSGITMTAGLALGLTREAAARFSFLLSIPVIAASSVLKLAEWATSGNGGENLLPMAAGFALSALFAYLCIRYFLRFIQRHSMGVFVGYRMALGGVILFALS
ncbi:MAG: undecaprenyl-diphosphate phosphatase [Nitrospirota bacterium]|nr:undecaprenyl-diphosphate phosphatase [Nitrospirota bacterium]